MPQRAHTPRRFVRFSPGPSLSCSSQDCGRRSHEDILARVGATLAKSPNDAGAGFVPNQLRPLLLRNGECPHLRHGARSPRERRRARDGAHFAERVVADGDDWIVLREALGDALGQVDRAVAPAGAADGDGEVTAVRGLVLGDARGDELQDVVGQARNAALRFEEADDVGVTAGERAQRRIPVGVGQRARVEHEVRVARNAVLEAEGLHQQATAGRRCVFPRAG